MLLNFFITLVTLLLLAGLALDGSNMQLQKLRLQVAADAAALGAARERALGKASWATAGQNDAALNGFTNGSNGAIVVVRSPPTSGTYNGDSTAIQAVVTQSVPTVLWRFIGASSTVSATAVTRGKASPECLYALNTSKSRALMLSGTINASCAAYVNSSNSDALHLDGGSSMTASTIDIVGSYTNSGTLHTTPTTGQPSITDPISTTAPTFSSCTYTGWKMDSSTGSKTLSPGTYCGGITLSGAYTATFQPGLYIVTGGINWNSGATALGNGVTFYFTQGGGYGYGQVVISGGVIVNLTAPLNSSAGGVTGILMWGDRNWNNTSQNVNFNGQSVTKMEGSSLLPYHRIHFVDRHFGKQRQLSRYHRRQCHREWRRDTDASRGKLFKSKWRQSDTDGCEPCGIARARIEAGTGTVEFLLMALALLLIFFGVLDFGRAYYAEICLVNAAYAGAQYGALVTGQSSNYTGMQTAANNDDPGTPGFTATASGYCACTPGGTSVSCAQFVCGL